MPNVKSIRLKTKELLTYQSFCHGNLVPIATRYVADAYHPKNIHTRYELNRTQDKRITYINIVVAMVTKLP